MTSLASGSDTDPSLAAAWSRTDLQSSLQIVVAALVNTVGFEVAGVVARYGPDEMRMIAVAGREDAIAATRGQSISPAQAARVFSLAEHRGPLLFVPDESRLPSDTPTWQAPEAVGSTDPDDWQPGDALIAPFYAGGDLLAFVTLDLPVTGRRPDEAVCRQVASLTALAERALLDARAAELALAGSKVREAARVVARRASTRLDVDGVLREVLRALVSEYGASGAWARMAPHPQRVHVPDDWALPRETPPWIVADLMSAGELCWEARRLLEITPGSPGDTAVGSAAYGHLVKLLPQAGMGSLLQVPLGAGDEYLGYLTMARAVDAPPWTTDERAEALVMGQDVGRALLTARTFDRERRLVRELQRVDEFKKELVMNFSHELRTPLTSLGAHLELLEDDIAEWPAAAEPLAAMRRSTRRLAALVDDLLVLTRLTDPDREVSGDPVDLAALVADVVRRVEWQGGHEVAPIRVHPHDPSVTVVGDRTDLARAVSTIVRSTRRHAPPDGLVELSLTGTGQTATITVSETGAGVRSSEQHRLLESFFDGEPSLLPGAGNTLALQIVERIVAAHHGSLNFETLDCGGGMFVLTLPVMGPDAQA